MFLKYKKGWRSIVYLDKSKGLIKKISNGRVLNRIENEVNWLNKLNKIGIGPKLISYGDNYLIIKFVNGVLIGDYINNESSVRIEKLIKEILEQCYKLDKMNVDKEEMTNPYKHIIVGKKVVMIDFERARFSLKPHNITGFCQYLTSKKIYSVLCKKGLGFDKNKLKEILKKYKRNYSWKDFKKIEDSILV